VVVEILMFFFVLAYVPFDSILSTFDLE